jgi:acyl transferase domain-containing protein/thioesterase domain-containing protein
MAGTEDSRIAIVGMAGRFPGAGSTGELWDRLCDGARGIRRFTQAELVADGVPAELAGTPDYVPVGADLPGVADFDADFFGIPHHEARLTDPQHRFFLESAWQALEDAGHHGGSFPGRVGVFGASGLGGYLHLIVASDELPPDGISYPVLLGNDKDFLCTRVSYRLNLTGPSVTVQTACSSSLVAVHLAVQSLLAGECELALAGGVSIAVPTQTGYQYREGGILSRDGHCRVFDAAAGGTVRGSGCAVVVLRPLADALADGDHIVAVIAGTAVNNDGSGKVGFAAPGAGGQSGVIQEALAVAELSANEISYVEAHGTGTPLGDPIEVRALAAAHAAAGGPAPGCYLGSLKANLGHLDAAAGVAGLIKTALVLRHQTVPVQVDFAAPNPAIAEHLDTYRIPTRTLRPVGGIRAAAVSSFGIGGTNAHAVLLAPPADERAPAPRSPFRVLLSARDPQALRLLAAGLREHLTQQPPPRLADLAFTLAAGRARWPARAGFLVDSVEALAAALDGYVAGAPQPAGDPVLDRWSAGEDVAPGEVGDLDGARRTPLPGHPMRRTRHWVDPTPGTDSVVSQPVPAAARPAAAGDVAGVVLAVAAELLQVSELRMDDDLDAAGLDSLLRVELVTRLRGRLGVPLRFEDFDVITTAADIITLLEPPPQPAPRPVATAVPVSPVATLAERYRHLLTRVRAGTAERNVILVPPAGGSVSPYVDLVRHSGTPATVWAVGFPAEDADRFPTLRDAARLYVELLRAAVPAGPYLVGGYSFGGNVAVEMALMLEAAGEKVDKVVMFDSHPPESYVGGSADESDFLAAFPLIMAEILPEVELPAAGAAPATLAEATAMIRHPSWSASAVAELTQFFDVWKRNHDALKRWYPDAKVRADVTVLAASEPENPLILRRLAIQWHDRHTWARHVAGRLTVRPVPGNHYSIFRDPTNLASLTAAYDAAVGL